MMEQRELELTVLSHLLEGEKDLYDAREKGVNAKSFTSQTKIYEFICNYQQEYGKLPTRETVSKVFALSFPEKLDAAFCVDLLLKRELRRHMENVLTEGITMLNEDEPERGLEYIQTNLGRIRRSGKYSFGFTDGNATRRVEEAAQRKSLGKLFGSLFDLPVKRIPPGSMIGIVGRLSVGKSFYLLKLLLGPYSKGKKILLLSPEMTREEFEIRWDAMTSKGVFSAEALMTGAVPRSAYAEWLKRVEERRDWVTSDSHFGNPFTLSSITSLVSEFNPDVLGIDGLPLISSEVAGGEGWQEVKAVSYGLQSLAVSRKIYIVVTTQASRDAANATVPELHQIAYGDGFGQACLVPGTPVRLDSPPYGYRPIESVNVGDKVFTHKGRGRSVRRVYQRFVDEEIVALCLGPHDIIRVTREHPILTTKGWVEAGEIREDDVLMRLSDITGMGRNVVPNHKGGNRGPRSLAERRKTSAGNKLSHALGIHVTPFVKGRIPHNKGIPFREACGGHSPEWYEKIHSRRGERASCWNGGSSSLPYTMEFTYDLKLRIRRRDGLRCQLCGRSEVENRRISKKPLPVHHIDYDKKNCDELNLIALCTKCNSRVNFRRDHWKQLLGEIVQRRYAITNGTRIRKIWWEHYVGTVYNLEVWGDQSYCGKGLIFHNCSVVVALGFHKDENKRYLAVPKNRFGKAFRPVEIEFKPGEGRIG